MPIYEYKCKKCDKVKEVITTSFSNDDQEVLCDDCNEKCEKVMSINALNKANWSKWNLLSN